MLAVPFERSGDSQVGPLQNEEHRTEHIITVEEYYILLQGLMVKVETWEWQYSGPPESDLLRHPYVS